MFIVWGWRGRTKEIETGKCYCPECGDYRTYGLKEVKTWFTLYWIPLFPTSDQGQYVECSSCAGTFHKRILDFDPKTSQEKFEAEFAVAAKRVMFKLALADGEVDESEIEQITQAFANIVNREVDADDIAAELEAAKSDPRSVAQFLAEVAPGLNDTGKERVLRSAISVALADDDLDESEVEQLHEVAVAMDMPRAYANGIFMEENIPTIS